VPARRLLLLGLALSVFFPLGACQRSGPVTREELHVFGSITDVEIRGTDTAHAEAAIAEASAMLNQREREWHPWKPSDLTRINAAFRAGQSVQAPPSIINLLRRSQNYAVSSSGLFDPGVGGLVELWGFHTSTFPVTTPVPTLDQVAEWLRTHPSVLDVSIQGDRLYSRNPAVQLDFDAVAEGAATSEIIAIFQRRGIKHALIGLGGDMMALGDGDGDGVPWVVGMKDPYGGALGSVELGDNEAFYTSGNYNKFREAANGARWGHILDPRTGMPARGAAATAVLVNDPILADAASTALMAGGPAGFARIVKQMKLGCALMVTEENELLITRAMRARMQFLRDPVALGAAVDSGADCRLQKGG